MKLGEFGTLPRPLRPARRPARRASTACWSATTPAQNYQGTFLVHEYQLEPVRLVVDTPRHVYYRGEEIEGTIRAAFYYGAPLAGREIRYQLADDRQHTATTDAKGEVHFKLPTREFSETQVLPLVVTLPERNLQTAVNFMLSAAGLLDRREHACGRSTWPARRSRSRVKAHRRRGQADRPRSSRSRCSSRPSSRARSASGWSRSIQLDTAADGTARKTLKLDKGGNYVAPRRGDRPLQEPDHRRVRWCRSPATRTRCGSASWPTRTPSRSATRPRCKVHWREEPALALVTFQGARVLDYRLVELKTGLNELSIPMTAKLAPNFELSVAVMTDAEKGGRRKGEGGGLRVRVQGQEITKSQIPNPKSASTKPPAPSASSATCG